jgi:hypothetical protein
VQYIEGPAGDLETGTAKQASDAAVAWSGGSRVDQNCDFLKMIDFIIADKIYP